MLLQTLFKHTFRHLFTRNMRNKQRIGGNVVILFSPRRRLEKSKRPFIPSREDTVEFVSEFQ